MIETVAEVGDLKAVIEPDQFTRNPRREWDCFMSTMYCFHRRYDLGDEHDLTPEEVQELANDPENTALPLYLLDHSGITMNTGGFRHVDPGGWDSGMVGYIIADPEKMEKVGFDPEVANTSIEDALRAEVEEYDKYLTGDVWCYAILKDDEAVDACCGLYGYEYAQEEAQRMFDYWHKKAYVYDPHGMTPFASRHNTHTIEGRR